MMSSASSPYRRWFFARGAAIAPGPATATPARNADDAAAHLAGEQ